MMRQSGREHRLVRDPGVREDQRHLGELQRDLNQHAHRPQVAPSVQQDRNVGLACNFKDRGNGRVD